MSSTRRLGLRPADLLVLLLLLSAAAPAFAPGAVAGDEGHGETAGGRDGSHAPHPAVQDVDCSRTHQHSTLGTLCDDPDLPPGLFAVRHRDGAIGFTHGADTPPARGGLMGAPSEADGPSTAALFTAPLKDPRCVDPSADHHMRVIYARPHDRPDRFGTMADDIRTYVKRANGLLDLEAQEKGRNVHYRVACTGGTILVENEVLPTADASSTFNTVVDDLRALGHTDKNEKYWVWYDTGKFGCSGVGHVYLDDSRSVDNANNAGPGVSAMFAVTFGPACSADNNVLVMMHENGHNMGAVQPSAPHTTGSDGLHCNDGRDIMCYADGGSLEAYDPNVCTDRYHFDCNADDYFHPTAPTGSYLDTHWNVGWSANRFLAVASLNAAPTWWLADCSPGFVSINETIKCQMRARDADGHRVYYLVDWGDGNVTRVPETGYVAQDQQFSASRAYARPGNFTITLLATDEHVLDPRSTPADTEVVRIVDPNTAPDFIGGVGCTPGWPRVGDPVTCTWTGVDADGDDVRYVVDWGDGTRTHVPAVGYTQQGIRQSATHAWSKLDNHVVTVRVLDNVTPPKSDTSAVVVIMGDGFAPCDHSFAGELGLGVVVLTQEGLNQETIQLPGGCGSELFQLSGGDTFNDFDVCFDDAAGQTLVCHEGRGDATGVTPKDAARARILYRLGPGADWSLQLREI